AGPVICSAQRPISRADQSMRSDSSVPIQTALESTSQSVQRAEKAKRCEGHQHNPKTCQSQIRGLPSPPAPSPAQKQVNGIDDPSHEGKRFGGVPAPVTTAR